MTKIICKIKYKLDSKKLNAIRQLVFNYAERRLLLDNIHSDNATWCYNIWATLNKREFPLFTYFDDDQIIHIDNVLNPYRIYELLEDIFSENIIISEQLI